MTAFQIRIAFCETLAICRAGWYEANGKRVELPPNKDVLAASKFYQRARSASSAPVFDDERIDVVKGDCIEVARRLAIEGRNPMLLNMASDRCPGGGVLDGASAQEEELFRRSNLCVSLFQYDARFAPTLGVPLGEGRYPMSSDTCGIYSGRVTFFRAGSNANYRLLEKPFECAVASVAAVRYPVWSMSEGRLNCKDELSTVKKIRTILRIALLNGHDTLVLSAFGCGAFHNPPAHMAEIFHRVLLEDEFKNRFRLVRFAIIAGRKGEDTPNYNAFVREFGATGK